MPVSRKPSASQRADKTFRHAAAVWLGAGPEWFLAGLAVLAAVASILAARRTKLTPVAPATVPDEMVGT